MRRFNGICIITRDVDRLGSFYNNLLHVEMQRDGDNIAFESEGAQLSIFSSQGMERMVPGCMESTGCGNFTIDFEVENIDQEYEHLTHLGIPCVKPPITYPWGRRSAWFRDPDDNLVNLFSRSGSIV